MLLHYEREAMPTDGALDAETAAERWSQQLRTPQWHEKSR